MARIRSKVKRNPKGKTLKKGQSASSNPQQSKYRSAARATFFQPQAGSAKSGQLQLRDLELMNERNAYSETRVPFKSGPKTIGGIAESLKDCRISDEGSEQSGGQTLKSRVQTEFSCFSNMTFKKFTRNYRGSTVMDRTMLAILEAITQVIKEKGHEESHDEYFKLLITHIDNSTEENDTFAGLALLAIDIKSVSKTLLRSKFDETATTLLNLLKQFIESKNQSVIKNITRCMAALLRALDHESWTYPSTIQYLDPILSLCTHSKPKIREIAQRSVASIVHGSSFIISQDPDDTNDYDTNAKTKPTISHPASNRITMACLARFKPEIIANSPSTVSHTLSLLEKVLPGLNTADIRQICQKLLSIMSVANDRIRIDCFRILARMFESHTRNLDGELCILLLRYLENHPPAAGESDLASSWLFVMKEGYLHLHAIGEKGYTKELPKYFKICISKYWKNDNLVLASHIFNAMKALIETCVATACESEQAAKINRSTVIDIINCIRNMLVASKGPAVKFAIQICSFVFGVCGKYFGNDLVQLVSLLADRCDAEQGKLRVQIEHAIVSAIKSMGPECILSAVPLKDASGGIIIANAWLLPLLREGLTGASFTFFKGYVLSLASHCNEKWNEAAAKNEIANTHQYELLTCQLYGLFPAFCRHPKDPENFFCVAPSIGNALVKHPEFHAPILDGIAELLRNDEASGCQAIIDQYAKNFLVNMCRIYMKKPETTYEADIRKRVMEVFKLYLHKAPADVRLDLYKKSEERLKKLPPADFDYYALFDLTAALLLFQSRANILSFFQTFIKPILKKNKKSALVSGDEAHMKKQQRRVYELLQEILESENTSCIEFVTKESNILAGGLLETAKDTFPVCQSSRLRCLKVLISSRESKQRIIDLVKQTIPELLINYKELSSGKDRIAEEVLKLIAEIYIKHKNIEELVDTLDVFFDNEPAMIVNVTYAFRFIVQHFAEHLSIETVQCLLPKVCIYLVDKRRAQAEAATVFLITFIKAFPLGLVANNLKTIMESLSKMQPDTKRYCRIQIGYILRKLCKRFRIEELAGYVPGDDELTHKRLKKISKSLRRQARRSVNDKNNNSEDDGDFVGELINAEKKGESVDDILADSSDSDSDSNDEQVAARSNSRRNEIRKMRKSLKNDFLGEDSQNESVDSGGDDSLADSDEDGKPTSTAKLLQNKEKAKERKKQKHQDVRVGNDGKIIISDKAWNQNRKNSSDESSDESAFKEDFDASDTAGGQKAKKSVKRAFEDDSSDGEASAPKTQKRKLTGASSLRSGLSSRYTTGGQGIHRSLKDGAASVNSGRSTKTTKTAQPQHTGSEYRSNKARGDIKKNNKLQPYAYIKLDSSCLNKRKGKAKSRAFKAAIHNATKGGKVTKPRKK